MAMARTLIKLPKRFFNDHYDRDLPTPEIVSETARHYIVDRDDPAIPELLNDAEFYASPDGPDQAGNLRLSAAAIVAALKRQAA